MARALEAFEPEHVLFVSSRDGLDELSITSPTDVIELKGGKTYEYTVEPGDVGLPLGRLRDIQVATPEESGRLIVDILKTAVRTRLFISQRLMPEPLYTSQNRQRI